MLNFTHSFTVPGKAPQEVFDFVTEPSNGTKWAGSAKEITAEGDPGVGRKIHVKAHMVISFDITQEVTTWEAPTHYAFGATSPVTVNFDFQFSPAGDGTKVDVKLDADPGKFIPGGSLLLKGKFKKDFQSDMSRLETALA